MDLDAEKARIASHGVPVGEWASVGGDRLVNPLEGTREALERLRDTLLQSLEQANAELGEAQGKAAILARSRGGTK